MALDPLKFKIAIERRQLQEDLQTAKRDISRILSDVPITVKISNLESLRQQLANLEIKANISGTSDQKKQVDNIKNTVSELEKLLAMKEKVDAALQKMSAVKNTKHMVAGFEDAERKLQEFAEKIRSVDQNNAQAIREIVAEWKNLGAAITEVTKKQEKVNSAKYNVTVQQERSLNQAIKSLADVDILLDKLKAKAKTAPPGIDLTELNKRIAALTYYRDLLDKIASGGIKTKNLNELLGGNFSATMKHARDELSKLEKAITNQKNASSQAEGAAKKHASAMSSGASAVRQMTTEEQRLSSAIQNTISQMNHQSQVLNDLKSMAFQYLSVYGAQQFLNNIIEIGGQLEMQRLSIGAILQNTAQANDLFDKIKGLALQSPFGVVELDQFTKQLSAYGFQYNELFEMTKRLADISAGAGTDVSRLALALGHVRAEGALTGYTLRQFAMNNIPMLGKLSEKLSELEGRTVTASEVRKRVSKKEVDYAMVESVIKELTDEGGMFYNMQETISQSVKAKWKNLRDAFDIMYGEMAESAVGGTLKDTATILTAMAKRWKELGTIILNVAKAYGAYKAYMMVYNVLLGQQARAVFTSIAAQRQAKVAHLQLASSYRALTASEQGYLLTSTRVSLADKIRMITNRQSAGIIRERIALTQRAQIAELSMAITTRKLGAEELARAVALGKVNKNVALLAIGNSRLHATQIAQMQAAVASVRTYGMLTGVVNGTAMAFTRLGAALKGLLMNPATWIFALIAGLTDLWQRNNQEMEKARDVSKALAERAQESVRNIQSMMSETGMSYKRNGKEAEWNLTPGGEVSHTPSSQMDGDAMIQTMEKWEEFIKNYSSLSNTLLQNALFDGDKLRSVTDQYDRLAEATETVMKSQQALAQIAEKAQFVIDSTNGGYLDDDIITNMDNYAKKVRASDAAISKFSMNHKAALAAVLNAAKGNEKFAKSIEVANKQMQEREHRNLTDEEQLKKLVQWPLDYAVAIRKAEGALSDLGSKDAMKAFTVVRKAGEGENQAYAELYNDMKKASDAIRQIVKENWNKSIDELTDYEKQALLQFLTDIAVKSGESTDNIKKKFLEMWAPLLKLPRDISNIDARINVGQAQKELDKLVAGPNGEGWTIDIHGAVDANGILQKIREAYKSARDTVNNMAPILFKMGFTIGQVQVMSEEDIKRAAGGSMIREMVLRAVNEAKKTISQAEKASNEYGFSLSDPNTSGKVFKDKKDKVKKDTNSAEEKEAREWSKQMKERIRLLKDSRSWYEKWEKELGHTAALEKVQEMFKGLVDPEDIASLENYKKALDAVIDKANQRKIKKGGKDERADEVMREAENVIQDIDLMMFKLQKENVTSQMAKDIENLTRQWDVYNNVLSETGDRMLALKMAGLFDRSNERNVAESLRANIEGMPGGDLIDFDKVMNMTDEEIEKSVQDMLGKSDQYSSSIEAITNGLKEWRKLSNDVMKQDIQNYAKLIGSAKDYWSLIMRNNSQYDDVVRMLNANLALGLIDAGGYMKGIQMAQADRDDKNSKLSANYINLMNNANALTRGEMLDAVENAVMHLEDRMKAGSVTIEEYVNELMKLKEIRAEWEDDGFFGGRGAFASIMKGGNQGLLKYYQSRVNRYETEAAEAKQKYGAGSSEYESANKQAEKYQKLYDNLKKLTRTVDDVIAVMQSLQSVTDYLGEVFSSLGMKGASTTMGDIGGLLGGTLSGANALSGFGTYGQIVGGALGLVSSVAQLGDKRRERQIEELKKEVRQIDDTLNLIRTAGQRELGYNRGRYRDSMYGSYAQNVKFGFLTFPSAAERSMMSYYGSGNGSGYTQELEALMKQREEYMKMYNIEHGKKNESEEALNEYKMKIAELDDQIKYFSEDLANELWGIDLKGWADQIGDALMNAFENGTSAAEAFKDATRGIMQGVVSEMLKIGFMEPMFETLRERLFGKNGAFNYADPKSSMGDVLAELGRFFGEGGEGQKMILASQEFLTGAEELLNKNFGMSLKDSSQATQTSGIQSQATEESIGILSGQMARIAQDVSVKRIFMTQIATEQMPKLLENAQMQRSLLENQFQSVRAIEHMMADGDGALYASIDRMSRKIDRAITPDGRMRIE